MNNTHNAMPSEANGPRGNARTQISRMSVIIIPTALCIQNMKPTDRLKPKPFDNRLCLNHRYYLNNQLVSKTAGVRAQHVTRMPSERRTTLIWRQPASGLPSMTQHHFNQLSALPIMRSLSSGLRTFLCSAYVVH